jgi:CII-binding regulator of phage lambda lysogenization HflD
MADSSELKASLEKLRSEIAALEAGDRQTKQRLEALVRDLEEKLDRPRDTDLHKDAVQHVDDAISQFEVSHPTLTAVLNDIMVKLSNMGI